jgi:NhaP-type Na+/H+ or K+/H+ antiporter
MQGFFSMLKQEGEDAVRRSTWVFCAILLNIVAFIFVAIALTFALVGTLPVYGALLISAGLLLLGALACMALASNREPEPAPKAATSAPPTLVDQATQTVIARYVESRPAAVLAIAAIAGFAVAALEAAEKDRK